MLETLFVLFVAHLLGDFTFQPDWVVAHKRRFSVLFGHVTVVTAVSALLLGNFHWELLLVLFGAHLGTDAVKVYLLPHGLYAFMADQLVHLGVIFALAWVFPGAAPDGYWLGAAPAQIQTWYLPTLTLLGGIILCVQVGGVLIGLATRAMTEEIQGHRRQRWWDVAARAPVSATGEGTASGGSTVFGSEELDGLRRGGRAIGWLERSLVMLLYLIGQPEGIAFLFAAKSILRFGEIKDAHWRKMTEYIIIGTFSSFGWALLTAYLTAQALKLW
jgi:hypothetical protein